MITITNLLVAVGVLIVALIIDLIFGDPSPILPRKNPVQTSPNGFDGTVHSKNQTLLQGPKPKNRKNQRRSPWA